MRRIRLWLAMLFCGLSLATTAFALDLFPLEGPDTSSPQATFNSFMKYSRVFYEAMQDAEHSGETLDEARERAEECFDLSRVAPSIRDDVALESVLRLREILDRIPLPEQAAMPDAGEARNQGLRLWQVPHTEIEIGRVGENPGEYLFTAETVDRLEDFYDEIRHLPYTDGAAQGIYEKYIYSSGWLIPDGFIAGLPDWMRSGYLGQAAWQWFGLAILLLFGLFVFWLVFLWHRRQKRKGRRREWRQGLCLPLAGMAECLIIHHVADTQINITGAVLAVVTTILYTAFMLFSCWAILVIGRLTPKAIISARHIKEEALNADVIRLVCQLGALIIVCVILYRTGSYFGLPVTAVFASAGIMGVAVALAARETLANFFGGVSIFLDRPFRAGDYIVLDSGERGEVKAVGMRSTRLLTRDGILVTIPNSVITNVKIVNQSAPTPHMRVRVQVGVAYDSDLDAVEEALLESARINSLVVDDPAPGVRLISFSDSAIVYELRAWAVRPHVRGRLKHELGREIMRRFAEANIEIPFPQLDLHVKDGREQV